MPLQVSQFSDQSIPLGQAAALCGPAAAIAFARANGRTPTLREAMELAKAVGWTPERGMAGPGSQQALLEKMGIAAELAQSADERKMIQSVNERRPVTVSTAHHYFTASEYDPQSKRFFVGASGTDAGGPEWMSTDEMDQLSRRKTGSGINGVLYFQGPVQQDQQRFQEANVDLPSQGSAPEASATIPGMNNGAVTAAVYTDRQGQLDKLNSEIERRRKDQAAQAAGSDFLQQVLRPQGAPKLYGLPYAPFPEPPRLKLPSLAG